MSTQDSRVWHYIKPNETTRIPRRHIFLDTESVQTKVMTGAIQTWRLGVACFRIAEKGRKPRETWGEYLDPGELWAAVTDFARKDSRTVVWAHNMGYDIRISEAFTRLPALGWRLDSHNLAPRGTWATWRRDTATLVMVDSASIYPTTLAAVGKAFGLAKEDLPQWTDDADVWMRRCRVDVEILRIAIITYLDWLETEDLGNWQLTGAGQSWAIFRHRFLSCKMLVHNDLDALAAERRALWTGRCEAYWHGTLDGQVIHEWDFSLAYARIAQTSPVPVRLVGPMPPGYPWRSILDSDKTALLACVTVTTDVPVVPTHHDGRILWPVGRFETTLWDVEIGAALRAGAVVEVHSGWLYRLRPALHEWAKWLIDQMEDRPQETPTWRKLILKHHARALIGRMAMTYTSWEKEGEVDDPILRRSTVYDRDSGESWEMMQLGGTVWRDMGRTEWAQSMPMVTGYVQAIARVRLWDVMQALPREALLYVDTDSILVTDRWEPTIAAIAATPAGAGLRLKRSWDGFAIYGPRQIRTGVENRFSGIPKRARRTGRHTYSGEIWESVSASLRSGAANRVVTRDREWTLKGVDRRRTGPDLGWTNAIRVETAKDVDSRERTTSVAPF